MNPKKLGITFLLFALVAVACSSKKQYDFGGYHTLQEQNQIMTSIIAHIFTPPVYVSKEDRLKPEHRNYYSTLTPKFKMIKYYVSEDGTQFFYLTRPSSIASERRAVAGHFRIKPNYELSDFREEFVTTVMTEEDLTTKSSFLFDEMVNGNLSKYIGMKAYIQWPNDISTYDTVLHEWKIKPGALGNE